MRFLESMFFVKSVLHGKDLVPFISIGWNFLFCLPEFLCTIQLFTPPRKPAAQWPKLCSCGLKSFTDLTVGSFTMTFLSLKMSLGWLLFRIKESAGINLLFKWQEKNQMSLSLNKKSVWVWNTSYYLQNISCEIQNEGVKEKKKWPNFLKEFLK